MWLSIHIVVFFLGNTLQSKCVLDLFFSIVTFVANTLFVKLLSSFIGDPDSGLDGRLLTEIRDNSEAADSGKPIQHT